MLWERREGWNGGTVWRTIGRPNGPYEIFHRSSEIVLCLICSVWSYGCPNKSTTKEGHRWSQCYLPKQSKKTDFCWGRCCWSVMCASWMTNKTKPQKSFSFLFSVSQHDAHITDQHLRRFKSEKFNCCLL